jgi:hypothetical protein
MAHLSSSFSHAESGKLLITLRGTFYFTTARDAGFPAAPTSGVDTPNIYVRAFVGPDDGTRKKTEPIDRYAPVAYLIMDYPGGSASWPIGTEEVAHNNPSGLFSYGIEHLSLEIKLVKV